MSLNPFRKNADAALVAVSLLQWGLWGYLFSSWEMISWELRVLFFLLQVALMVTQFQTVAHYFIHRPFFHGRVLNSLFSALNSANLGVPTFLYWSHHMNHHQYSNAPGDLSSLYLHGRGGHEETLARYALLSPLRTDFVAFWKDSARKYSLPIRLFETAVFLAFLALAARDLGLLAWVAGVIYCGQVLAAGENYLEHFGSDPADDRRNSVSCYSGWYNLVWFNNGYHQEHHLRPSTHWTELPGVESNLPARATRPLMKGAHWFFWNRPQGGPRAAEL